VEGIRGVEVRPLRRDEIPAAARLAARALRDNPSQVAVHGDDPDQRVRGLEILCRLSLVARRYPALAAYRDGALVGVLSAAPPGACTPSLLQQLRMAPSLLRFKPETLARVARYGAAWQQHEPKERHWHVGPVAVEPALQGQGIGSAMLARFCTRMDERGDQAYLETDTPANVALYRRFGFDVIAEAAILGAPYWFMRRRSR